VAFPQNYQYSKYFNL